MQDSEYPSRFYCPITGDIMKDPVITPSGNSYERTAIEQWLRTNSTDPLSRERISIYQLIPNRALKEEIEQALTNQTNPSVVSSSVVPTPSVQLVQAEKLVLTATSDRTNVLLTIKVPTKPTKTPVNVCCVIDVSGSMGVDVEIKDQNGSVERNGLSQLDIVKHATKTIISALGPDDRFGLVVFSSSATIKFNMSQMTNENKTRAINALDTLTPDGSTNIWDGLRVGMGMFGPELYGKNCAVILLTDGEPTESPTQREVHALKTYMDSRLKFPCSINTVGFGYRLKSKLLQQLAKQGNGTYAYIPDASFVGTVFVNMMANLCQVYATNVNLVLETQGNMIETVKVPFVGSGQARHFIVPAGQFTKAYLTYTDPTTSREVRSDDVTSVSYIDYRNIKIQMYRLELVAKIVSIIQDAKRRIYNNISILELVNKFNSSTVNDEPYIKALVKELNGQISQAVSREDWYRRWGRHYLRSVYQAHSLEMCNNFKDAGVQFYGDVNFRAVRDTVDKIFNELPPPTPSNVAVQSTNYLSRSSYTPSSYSSYRSYTPVRTMSSYNSHDNGCIHGDCTVLMHDGTNKLIKDIKKGDIVATPSGKGTVVVCVVKTDCTGKKIHLAKFEEGLKLTPYHPVRFDGKWMFPCTVTDVEETITDAIYDFVLYEEHVMIVNGIECCTFGHGMTDDDVIKHEYFGSKIVDDLKNLSGWANGLIELQFNSFVRDPETTLIVGLNPIN